MENKQSLWESCVAFHGHSCGGLAIGFQASLYALELLEAGRAGDEELVCIAECDACGVDAIQAMLGCTVGKGNLLFKLRGKQAFSFYNRKNGKSVRLVLRPTPPEHLDDKRAWLMNSDYHDLFDCKPAVDYVPEPARIFRSCVCSRCGEQAAENYIRLEDGACVCLECYREYRRFS